MLPRLFIGSTVESLQVANVDRRALTARAPSNRDRRGSRLEEALKGYAPSAPETLIGEAERQ